VVLAAHFLACCSLSPRALIRRETQVEQTHRGPLYPIREVRSEPSHTRLMGEPKAKRVRHRNALLLGFSRATGEAMTAGLQLSNQLSSPSVSFPFLARCALLANLIRSFLTPFMRTFYRLCPS
jgi:hypothetical protein